MTYLWPTLLPPLIVLILGFLSRNITLSLSVGIISSAFIGADYIPLNAVKLAGYRLIENFSSPSNIYICCFLFQLGILITLIHYAGGARAYGRFITRFLKNPRHAESSSLLLSLFLFIDDYLSILTVGSVMTPITDKFRIARAKLAFLIDAMAAPLAILCPFSSWVAAIVGFLKENGVHATGADALVLANPFTVYLKILPFIFYSTLIMFASWYIVLKKISFGKMKQYEEIAATTGNVFGGEARKASIVEDIPLENLKNNSLADFFGPIGILFVAVIGGILYTGDATLFGGQASWITAMQNAQAAYALFLGGTIALIYTTVTFWLRGRLTLAALPRLGWQGSSLMFAAVLVLVLAWTLGDILRLDLATGQYIAHLLLGHVNLVLLPLLFFITAIFCAVAIGSSWGTAAILFPIAIPMILSFYELMGPSELEQMPLLIPVLGALLSGCVAGDHISPISDTTLMTSTITHCSHMDHVRTQMSYAIPTILVSALSFLAVGVLSHYTSSWGVAFGGLGIGIISLSLFLSYLHRRSLR